MDDRLTLTTLMFECVAVLKSEVGKRVRGLTMMLREGMGMVDEARLLFGREG